MKRLAPALRAVGIEAEDYREPTAERRRMWKLSHKRDGGKEPSEPSGPSEEYENPRKTDKDSLDGSRTASESLGRLFDDPGQLSDGSQERSHPKENPANQEFLNGSDGSDGCSHQPPDASSALLRGWLENPPEWFLEQAAVCVEEGMPERLLNPLANAVSTQLFGTPWRWRDVLPAVEEKLKGMA